MRKILKYLFYGLLMVVLFDIILILLSSGNSASGFNDRFYYEWRQDTLTSELFYSEENPNPSKWHSYNTLELSERFSIFLLDMIFVDSPLALLFGGIIYLVKNRKNLTSPKISNSSLKNSKINIKNDYSELINLLIVNGMNMEIEYCTPNKVVIEGGGRTTKVKNILKSINGNLQFEYIIDSPATKKHSFKAIYKATDNLSQNQIYESIVYKMNKLHQKF